MFKYSSSGAFVWSSKFCVGVQVCLVFSVSRFSNRVKKWSVEYLVLKGERVKVEFIPVKAAIS